jgi:ABC-type branched-subunit amino acid transport system substrate-binding protein
MRSGGEHTIRPRPFFRACRSALCAALSVFVAAGCSLVVDTNANQCESDADCEAKGPGFEGTLCTAEKVCGKITCQTHAECTERLGESAYCRPSDSTCMKVASEECTGGVYPENALEREDVLLIGFLGQLRDEYKSYGTPLKEGAELALHDIETNTNGLPAVGDGPQRHLAMVLCHDMDDPVRAARHLVDDLEVPAIIGPAFSGKTQAVVHDASLRERLLVITASATTPALSTERSPYFWRTVPSDAIQARALTKLVTKGLDVLVANGTLESSKNASVAVANIDNAYGNGISRAFFDAATDLNVTPVAYADPTTIEPASKWKEKDAPQAVQQIIKANPSIVVGLATTEFDTDVLPGIEKGWETGPAPLYLLPEGAQVSELSTAVSAFKLSGRLLGTAPGARRSRGYDGFALAFQATFGHAPGNLAEFAYDAAYLIAYATAIANTQRPSASDLAAAMSGVACTDPKRVAVVAGPSRFQEYFSQAALTGCIDFDGISGPLDFDPVTHEAASDIAIWCVRPNGEIVKDDPYYEGAKDEIFVPENGVFDFECGN